VCVDRDRPWRKRFIRIGDKRFLLVGESSGVTGSSGVDLVEKGFQIH
jgi:hypothetical protein